MGRQRGRGARWCGLPVAALLLAALGAPCAGLCSEKALQRREEEANVVLTGTVEEIMNMDPVHNTYSCKVRVWRYLKGKTMVNGEVLLDGGNKVMIGGFGDPGICDNQVSTGDTRIFFVNLAPRYMWPAHKNELMLNSSLMRITLRNLEEVENYVEDKPPIFTPVPVVDGCRGMLCGFGAVCEKNSADPSKGECVCKKMTCQSVVAPVCGSDSSTYSNECELEKAQCNTQRRIKVLRKGPCSLKDPCSEMNCTYGSTCIQSSDGLSAKCMCPLSCDNLPWQTVCGSDGKDYSSECELHRKACENQRNVRVQFTGPCNPCKATGSTVCRVEPLTRKAILGPQTCSMSASPVCASDGNTYLSECQMTQTAMETKTDLRVIHTGVCRKQEQCKDECKFNGVCLVEGSSARCSCEPIHCDGTYNPLCGSDGSTYPNVCEKRKAECLSRAHISTNHSGPCDLDMPSPCLKKKCHFGAACVVQNGEPVCECPNACPQAREPVCGSDGQTYGSRCEMHAMSCALQKEIHVLRPGPCVESCLNCSFGGICDGQTGKCVCPTECVDIHQPVCGSDGVTYENECKLNVKACTKQLDLKVVAREECKTCGSTVCVFGARCVKDKCECPQCQDRPYKPVCGSDGTTFDNECELQRRSCHQKKIISVTKSGTCDEDCGSGGSGSGESSCGAERCRLFGGSWDDDAEDDRCVCDFSCQNVPRSQLCGIDGRTYNNECELKKAQCERQEEIVVDKQGPCKGVAPPVSPVTSVSHCSQTVYGCCQDNKTAALGVGGAGCPETCQCNSYGSYRGTCDPATGQCSCKPGVGGLKCDRCEPGFWNFRAIVTANMSGCTPCNCDAAGSVRDDCEQMTGLCSCKPGLKGLRCSVCPDGSSVGASGCNKGANALTSCKNVLCKFGASCVELNGHAHCECPSPDCDLPSKTKVCGTDGVTYADECQLRTIACRQDKDIKVKHTGQCTAETISESSSRPTRSPQISTHAALSTTHVQVTTPRPHPTSTEMVTTEGIEADDNVNNINYVEAPAPLRPPTSAPSTTAKRPTTTIAKVPHKMPPPTLIRLDTGIEESGSGLSSGDDDEEDGGSGSEASGDEPSEPNVERVTIPEPEERSSCDNTAFGCCPDGRTMAINPEGDNCPPTMRFSGFLHLDQVEGQEVFYTPEMEDPKSELFGETARSIESALSELFRKSDVQKDFKSVRVRNLAPSNSILAFVEAHFNPDTRFTLDEVQGALLKQLKATKEPGIVVKKPEEENIRFSAYGLPSLPYFTTMTTMVAAVTTPTPHTTTHYLNNVALTTHRLPFTRRPFTSHHTTTVAPETNWHQTTTPPPVHPTSHHVVHTKPGQPCDSQPCQHGGSCENSDTDFTCICPAGRGGAVCEKVITYYIPAFGGKSYLAFPTMKAYHTVRIAMEFRTSEMNGILLYNGQSGKKDFLSLALIDGKVELRFNTGSGTCSVVSKTKVKQGSWHQLVVTRNRRTGILSVDGEEEIRGQSPPGTDGLNLDTDLFIGGIPEDLNPDVKERTSISTGLHGCIRLLDVNNMVYNLQEKDGNVLYGSGVGECGNNPCLPNPCRNGAMCQIKEAEVFHCKCVNGFSGPTCADAHNPCDPNKCHPSAQCQVLPEGGYKCECPMGREGRHCEKVSDRRGAYIPFFAGDSFLELKGLHLYGHDLRQKVSMSVVLMAEDPNGMIFYNGQKTDGKGDFISLALNDGILEFRYDLGKGPAVIRSREKIKMKQWTTVNLERANRKGEININGKDPVKGESPNQHTDLNLKESFLVGGAPDFRKLARASALKDGFKGAIQKISLMGTPILKAENALNSRDVSMFSEHPCSKDTCLNGGRCNPLLDSYECVCLHGFTGTHCENTIFEKSAGESEAIAFDGRTFIEYHNGVTKSPKSLENPSDQSEKALLVNKFELSIKTEATQGLILWSGKGVERSDYIALAIVDGRVQMTYDLGSKPVVLRSSVRVNTNRWIRIKASRALRDGSLQVGNEAAVTGSSPLAATQLDTDGALWLGGLEELGVARRLPKAYSTGFVGCVKDVLVDGVELHLVEDALNSPKILHCSAK
ncbi:agrin isoform X3 [Denticeps clupeoides]|uniref:agrin isoform X3 n=1 Tax=Denticeps clupeoides TaxID=299321 RepID=UPI0010A41918|nr:agrin isoform X3 [Denticeps clupeoides]